MSDECRRHPTILEKLFLEGEDTEKTVDHRAHDLDPAPPPSPSLRSNEVDNRNAHQLQFLSEAEMEIRGIGQNRERGTGLLGGENEFLEILPDTRQVHEHFHDADH